METETALTKDEALLAYGKAFNSAQATLKAAHQQILAARAADYADAQLARADNLCSDLLGAFDSIGTSGK